MFNLFKRKPPRRKKYTRPEVLGPAEIQLEGRNVRYLIKRSFRARLIWLKYQPPAGLQVTVPANYRLQDLPDFLRQHSAWILRHIDAAAESPAVPEADLSQADSILLRGRTVPLERRSGARKPSVTFDGSRLRVETATATDRGAGLVLGWLKEEARRTLTARVEYWSPRIGVIYNRITIRSQRTRWGSCSHLKNLSFNWRLITLPEEVLDYVVIHELCHLREMNHGRKFWKTVETCCPQWRELRRRLNRYRPDQGSGA